MEEQWQQASALIDIVPDDYKNYFLAIGNEASSEGWSGFNSLVEEWVFVELQAFKDPEVREIIVGFPVLDQ